MYVPQRAAVAADFVEEGREFRRVDEYAVGLHQRRDAAALSIRHHFAELFGAQVDVAAVEIGFVGGHDANVRCAHFCGKVDVGFRLVDARTFAGMVGKRGSRSQHCDFNARAVEKFARFVEVVRQFLDGGSVNFTLHAADFDCRISEVFRRGNYVTEPPVRASYRGKTKFHNLPPYAVSMFAASCNLRISIASSRSLNFWILPLAVTGNESIKRT